jgi:hypothetical protein
VAQRVQKLGDELSHYAIELEEPTEKISQCFKNRFSDEYLHILVLVPLSGKCKSPWHWHLLTCHYRQEKRKAVELRQKLYNLERELAFEKKKNSKPQQGDEALVAESSNDPAGRLQHPHGECDVDLLFLL